MTYPLPDRLTRRKLLGLAAAGVGAAAWPVEQAAAGPRAVASGAVACVLAPEMTEGDGRAHRLDSMRPVPLRPTTE